MVDKSLLEYIWDARSKNYSTREIQDKLVENGYSVEDAYEAVKAATQAPKKSILPSMPVSYYLVVGFIGALLVVSMGYIFLGSDDCGNGKIDSGETEENCCIDVLCDGKMCIDCAKNSGCGTCQYKLSGSCVDFDCCEDSDCQDDERCGRNECHKVLCDTCQFAENHDCKDYECCIPDDCAPGQSCVGHICQGSEADVKAATDKLCAYDSDCFDNNASTKDTCMPRSKTCSNPVWECIGGDEYCPPHCQFKDDDDCERMDECSRNADCSNTEACKKASCSGIPKTCSYEDITMCLVDGCCPPNCNSLNDPDC